MEKTRFARLITMKVEEGKGRRFVQTFKSEVASTATGIPGLRRLYLLRPVGRRGEFVALSLWEDKSSAEDYARSGLNDKYTAKLGSLLKEGERIRKFEVESHVVGKTVKVRR
jgi:heme-degrading monooxygenase HmoA